MRLYTFAVHADRGLSPALMSFYCLQPPDVAVRVLRSIIQRVEQHPDPLSIW